MKEQGITLSVIAAGGGSATYLRDLAVAGGGRYYPAADIQSLPQLFLKETIQVAGRYIIEQPFFPLQAQTTPVMEGIAALPGLYGYNGSTPKGGARVPLISPDGDPVLAQWQYGLGRTAAWTSDLTGRWAREWVEWDHFSQFVGQLAGWVLPDAASDRLQAGVRLDGDRLRVEVDAVDEGGQPWNLLDVRATVIGPDLAPHELSLSQTAPGRYEGQMSAAGEGAFLAQVAAQQRGAAAGSTAAATTSSGAVLAYSPEYRERDAGAGALLLRDLASATGGRALAAPDQAWARTGAPASAATPVSPTLLLLAALLLPLDVAVRRLVAGRRELAELRLRLRQWLARGRAPEAAPGSEPELLGDLFEARSRGRLRSRRDHTTDGASKDEPR